MTLKGKQIGSNEADIQFEGLDRNSFELLLYSLRGGNIRHGAAYCLE
jgi:hypothetical protein